MGLTFEPLGKYVRMVDERNTNMVTESVLGINIDKYFMPSVANVIGTDLSNYKLLRKGRFACNPMHVGRDGRLPVSRYAEDVPAIVSPAYFMFEIIDENEIEPEYLMLCFRRPDFDRMCWFRTDASVRGGITWEDVCALTIPVPPISEQRKIVHDYQVITDRIELLRKMNENLEEISQTVFKAYFETFEMFGGVCPDSISVKSIDSLPIDVTDFVANGSFASLNENITLYDEEEYAYYVRNTDLKVNDFTKYVDEDSYNFLSKSTLFGGEVIISNVADVGSVFMCPYLEKPMTLGSNIIMLRSAKNIWSYFMYLYFKYFKGKNQIVEITTGSAQLKFNKTSFRELKILVPDKDVLQSFNDAVKPIFELVDKYMCDMRYLKQLSHKFLASISFKGA